MANDLRVQIQAELERQLSTGNINGDIKSLQSKLNKVKLKAELDTTDIGKINTQIKNLSKGIKPIDVKLKIDDSLNANKITGEIESSISKSSKKPKVKVDVDYDERQLNERIEQLTKLMQKRMNVQKEKYGKVDIGLDAEALDKFNNALNKMSFDGLKEAKMYLDEIRLNFQLFNAQTTSDIPQNAIESMNRQLALMPSKITDVETNFKRLQNPTEKLNNDVRELRVAYEKLNTLDDTDKRIKGYSELKDKIQIVTKEVASLNKEQSQQISAFDKSKFNNSMTAWLNDNTKAASEFENQIRKIQLRLVDVDDKTSFNNLKKEFQSIQKEAKALDLTGRTFVDELKNNLGKFTSWFGVSQIVMTGVNTVKNTTREMINNVEDLNKAQISLKKVTEETDATYNQFLKDAATNAKALGSDSLSDMVEMTATWSKLGYDLKEATDLAGTSTIYANVGELNSTEKAVGDLVTVMKAYNIEAQDAISITDKFNEIGNKYAIDAAALGDGISNAASALQLAGNSLDESLAMLTAMTEITQEASESGNSIKILSMRLRGKHDMPPYVETRMLCA